MTDARKPQSMRKNTISRRDFVLGRRWQHDENETILDDTTTGAVTEPSSPAVRRYPQVVHDIFGGKPAGQPDSTFAETSLSVETARRRTIPVLRPPGAIEESSFLAGCTRCELCIEACPHDAIMHAPAQLREAAGTPMIDADRQPCLMCADFPCISACEPGVLTPLVPPRMGTARITEQLCLPYHGTSCTECSHQCPVENAIVIRTGKPVVSETCTGCGVCRSVCPAPENAILLMPMFVRPAPDLRARGKDIL